MFNYQFKNNYTWLRVLLVIVLMLGVFFRLVNLDRKVYWYDEGFTSLRVGGYTIPEVVQSFNGQIISVADFRNKYLTPNSERGFLDTIKSLAVEDPQHPPLYYLMTHLWMQWFGNSVAAIRSLPALISLLVFPCAFWLCLELFHSPLVAWIAVAIIAVSPFHVLFAQEAREYSLWTVMILLSSATLLQALRLKTVYSWGIYALTLTASLYTFLFSVFVAIGHGIYVLGTESRLSKTVVGYFVATVVAFVAFIPWIRVVINNYGRFHDSTSWMTQTKIPLLHLAILWAKNIGTLFLNSTKFDYFLFIFIVVVAIYSLYFVCRYAAKTIWLFILSLFGVTAVALIIPDLLYGGQRSIIARFSIPCYLSIQLAVSYLLATGITHKSKVILTNRKVAKNANSGTQRECQFVPSYVSKITFKHGIRKFCLFVMIVIFTGGVISSAILSQSEVPWNKSKNYNDYKIARTINQAVSPLVIVSNYQYIYDCNATYLFSFSHLLASKVKLQLVNERNIPNISNGFSDIFIYNPCQGEKSKPGLGNEFQALIDKLKQEQNYNVEPVISKPLLLWRLEKTIDKRYRYQAQLGKQR